MHAVEISRRKGRHAVSAQLSDMAHSKGPGAKLPTQRELCKLLGASTQTMDHALADLEAKNVICRRQGSGIFVSPKIHRKTIFVLLAADFFESETSPFWGMLWTLFAKEAQNRASVKDEDFQFHLVTLRPSEDPPLPEQIAKEIEAGKVDGVLCIGMTYSVFAWLESRNVPSVSYAGPGKWEIEPAVEQATAIAVDSLVKDGCRSIGLWAPEQKTESEGPVKLEWFQSALKEQGLTFNPAFVAGIASSFTGVRSSLTYQEMGRRAAMRLFGDPGTERPDGIVIHDDMMADGVIAGLEKLGVRVGEDVKIAAFTNRGSPILFGDRDKLTRIEFDPNDIPTAMLRILDDAMSGQDTPAQVVRFMAALRRNED